MAQGSGGWTPRWSDEKRVTPIPFFQLSEAQVQAFETAPGPG